MAYANCFADAHPLGAPRQHTSEKRIPGARVVNNVVPADENVVCNGHEGGRAAKSSDGRGPRAVGNNHSALVQGPGLDLTPCLASRKQLFRQALCEACTAIAAAAADVITRRGSNTEVFPTAGRSQRLGLGRVAYDEVRQPRARLPPRGPARGARGIVP